VSNDISSAHKFNLDGVDVYVFVHGEDRGLAGLALPPSLRAVAVLVEAGLDNTTIAAQLGIAPATLRRRMEALYRKVGVHSRSELVGVLVEKRRSS
jgi:DNA-binding NarL/FixJ family response regulator